MADLLNPQNNFFAILNGEGELVGFCSFGADGQVPGGNYSEPALLHVYLECDEMQAGVQSILPGLRPMQVFAHYQGDSVDAVRQQFRRVHDCNRYDLIIQA